MKLVQFEDGTYGVRTFWFFGWWFRDLACPGFSWKVSSRFFYGCKGTKKKARSLLAGHKVVK